MASNASRQRRNHRLPDPATIRKLLVTWPVRQMQGVAVPPPPDGGRDDPEWSWKYELRYGAPKLDDRESAIQISLTVLANGGRDVGAITVALQQIKGMALQNALLEFTLSRQRDDADEADRVRRNLTKWLARAIRLHVRSNPDDLPTGRRTYEAMLTALTFNEHMTDQDRALRDWLFAPRPAAMRRRRATRGNPDGRLVKDAHRILSAAKVPREQHRALLWAIGVVDETGRLPRRNLSRK